MERTMSWTGRSTACEWSASLWDVLKRMPLTAVLVVATVAIAASPSITSAWEFDRAAIFAGQWWRIATGHFTHWNFDHLLWDLTALAVLGAYCERQRPRVYAVALVASIVMISASLWFGLPTVGQYRGLSGIDSALFVLACGLYASDAHRRRDALGTIVAALAVLCFLGKIAFESLSGSTLFVDAAAAGFTPLPITHLLGGLAAAAVLLLTPRHRA
jgi:rhomboid family GlyGly-CTERM serine protease